MPLAPTLDPLRRRSQVPAAAVSQLPRVNPLTRAQQEIRSGYTNLDGPRERVSFPEPE